MKNKTELLAPVGSMDSLYAAVQNGANAIYLGGKLFNARQYASNFDFEELKEAVKYAHLRDVKVYVTVNILIDNGEIEEALDYIKYLYEIDIDGIIIQDIGLASLIRECLPDLELHGSTQMTVNNLQGAEFLYNMGFTRVVLARETPIEEIKYIHENTPIELEAFIHGALCVSYSGQCLMSSLIGGRSGNRGRCAQPCRLPYSIVDEGGRILKDWDRKYVLSTRDLNTLEEIEEIIDSGIVSLKIEGRMKRPEYVATVVSNYRKALDFGVNSIDEGDRRDIEQIFNRGFTKGLMFGDFGDSFISTNRPDNRGIVVGKVENVNKFKVSVKLNEDIFKGDGLELEGKNGYEGIIATYPASRGSIISLEKRSFIEKGSTVYKTSSVELLDKARASYEKSRKKKPINMEVTIKIGENPRLKGRVNDKTIEVQVENIAEKGEKISLSEDKIKEQLSKLGDTTYILGDIKINLDESVYLPLSALNELRRIFVEALDREYANFNDRGPVDKKAYEANKINFFNFKKDSKNEDNNISIKVSNLEQFNQLDLNKLDRVYLGFYEGLDNVIDKIRKYEKEVYIWTDKILYKNDLQNIAQNIGPFINDITGISVSNMGSLEYFKNKFNTRLHGDIGLNIFNSFTLNFFNSMGLSSATLSPELNLNQIKNLLKMTDGEAEAIVYGYLPLMVMKHCPMALVRGCVDDSNCGTCKFAKGYGLKDRIGTTFYMDRKEGFTSIYNSIPIMVLDNLDKVFKNGLSLARLDFTIEKENIKEIQSIYYDYAKGIADEELVKQYLTEFRKTNKITNGHFFRGVI